MLIVSLAPKSRACLVVAALLLSVACAGPGAESAQTVSGEATPPPGKLFATTPANFDRIVRTSGGLPTVVNVWATWCIPCRAEMPRFVEAAKRYEGDVRFLGLNSQDDNQAAHDFIDRFDVPFPSGSDPQGKVTRHLRVLGLPTTFFYRPDGELAFVHNGEISGKELTAKIGELIQVSAEARTSRR